MQEFHWVRWDSFFFFTSPSFIWFHLTSDSCPFNTQIILVNVLRSFPLLLGSENSLAQESFGLSESLSALGWRQQIFNCWPWLLAEWNTFLSGRTKLITAKLLLFYWYAIMSSGLLGILLHKTTWTLIDVYVYWSTYTNFLISLAEFYCFRVPLVRSSIII